jgi:hypothetical protein
MFINSHIGQKVLKIKKNNGKEYLFVYGQFRDSSNF